MKYLMVFAMLQLALGCASDDSDPVSKSQAFALCASSEGCEEGLFCAQGGQLAGHCASACTKDEECIARYGQAHLCGSSVCIQICGKLASGCTSVKATSPFETCGDGLACRAESSTQCVSQCTTSSWGTVTRTPGLTTSGSGTGGGFGGVPVSP